MSAPKTLGMTLLLLSLLGCETTPPAPSIITVEKTVICPERTPAGECNECTLREHPPTVLESQADAAACAEAVLECRRWHDKRDAAEQACVETFREDNE